MAATTTATPAPTSSSAPTLDNLYARNPGTQNVSSTPGATATNATASNATGMLSQASTYDAKTQDVPTANLASSQLNSITSQDSPLMQQAASEGMLLAARRGLSNSSLAAGASEGAMVDKATPLAQQNASQLQDQALANQNAENTSSQFNAGEQTNVSQQNAQLQTTVNQQNAQNATDVSKQNAGEQTAVSQQNAQTAATNAEQNASAQNTMTSQVMQANADLNKQFLAGTQSMSLAQIQGQYQQLISTNETASNLYTAYFSSISQAMANKDIPPDRLAQEVNIQQSMLASGLKLIDQMNTLQLGNFTLPGATSSGTGQNAKITPTPGTGATGTGPAQGAPAPTTGTPANGAVQGGKIFLNGRWFDLGQVVGRG